MSSSSVPSAQSIVRPILTTGAKNTIASATYILGDGQDPHIWCDNFKARVMRNCAFWEPDFFNYNIGRAPALPGIDSWAATPAGVVTMPGINLRFDFSLDWNPRDAQHDRVRSAIREATWAGAVFANGLR
ncbi:hypothetical protein F4813DRAFT_386897 [Daldinia decipiens]|uniref:uncharacterized protein n=1 Tax=Daldinia decipiens TaxID=326647 RepID=UPI0020C1C13E|nr:uncharacterized protein F4813DRAFT_386897 [Daldinia decipiens]KAI1660026.1 hypothetical protein F4813DRAFT_386897 [Daldinia decipiens]